ncbi:hypothetical protein C0993_003151, partial [Termitomyces sp. T159_Od127]
MDSDESTPLLSSNGPPAQAPSIPAVSRRVAALDASQIRLEDVVNGFEFDDHPTE